MAFGATALPKKLTALLFLSSVLIYANPDDSYRKCWTMRVEEAEGKWCLIVRMKGTLPSECFVAGDAFTLGCRLEFSKVRPTNDDQVQTKSNYPQISGGFIEWYKDGQPIGDRKVGPRGLTFYEINSSQIGDSGNYTCKVKNWHGKNFAKTLSVNVQESAGKITTTESSIRVKLHDPATLSCLVKGHSPSDFTWTHTEIEGVKKFTNLGLTSTKNNTDSTLMTLHLSNVSLDMGGIYECRARSCSRELADSINLTVFDVPKVSKVQAKAVGASRVCLNWTLDDGDDPAKLSAVRRIENRTEPSQYPRTTISNSSLRGLRNALVVDNLNDSTSYQFEVVFTNSAGDSLPAYSERITTLGKEPNPDSIPKLEIQGVTLDTIDVRAPSLPVELQGWVDYYHVMVTDSEGAKQLRNWTNIDSTFSIINRTSETSYGLRVAACNTCLGKCGNWSDETEVSTAGKEFEYDAELQIRATKNDSIEIGWKKPTPAEIYRISKYAVEATFKEDWRKFELDRTILSFIFENLTSEVEYELAISVCMYGVEECNRSGPGKKIDTRDREPKFVPTISVREITPSSIVVTWTTPPEHLRGDVYQYKVMATNQNDTRGPIFLSNRTTSFTFGDLKSQTEFQLQVAACSIFTTQCGKWSNTENGVTIDQGSIPLLWPGLGAVAVVIVIGMGVWACFQRHQEKVLRRQFNNVTLQFNNR